MTKRLFMILEHAPVLTERFVIVQATALASAGWEVTIVQGDACSPQSPKECISCLHVPIERRPVPRTLRDRGLRMLRVCLTGNGSPATADTQRIWAEFLRAEKPDLLLLQFGPTAALLLPALRAAGTPWAVQFHGFDATTLAQNWSYRAALRVIGHHASACFACSEFLSEELRRQVRTEDAGKVHPIGPGFDGNLYRPFVRDSSSVSDVYQVLSVARLVAVKGHLDVVAAIASCPSFVHLKIVGEGDQEAEIRALIATLGLQDRVELVGALPPSDVLDLMKRSDLFIQASRRAPNGAVEGLGLSPLEAAATGLPVIVTRSGGLAETCVDGVTGLVCEPGDLSGLSAAIERLASDPSLGRKFGEAGASWATTRFSSSAQAERATAVLAAL